MPGIKAISRNAVLLALLGSCGCAPAHKQALRTTFVPPSSHRGPLVTPDPPPIPARTDIVESARLFPPGDANVRTPRGDALLHDADWHYQNGRNLYQAGDATGARREFDRAVDVLLSAPEDAASRGVFDKKLDELVDVIHRLDLSGLGSADVASEPRFEKPPLEDMPELTFPVDPKLKNKVAEELRATASQLPLQVTDAVVSFINYFSTERGHKILVFGLRRAGRYRAMIRRIFDEEGVPQELIFVAQAESGFLPRAVSRKKATGMWQFGQERGREYGLNQSPYSDDRLDPEKATRAAARHLRDLYHRYGDWYLAMGAYNCGPGVIDKGVERTGYADFWELRRRNTMPRDTANYVPAILAMTIMTKNAKEYGLENLDADPPLEYDTIEITAPTHLQLVADVAECPVSQLHDLNPALLKNVAPGGAALRIPKNTAGNLAAVLETVPTEPRAAWRAHGVAPGETLSTIAHRYAVSEASIASVNRSAASAPDPGEVLIIPAAAPREAVATRRNPRASTHRGTARKGSHTAGSASAQGKRPVAYTASTVAPHRGKPASVKQ